MSENKHGIDKGLIRDLANILNETDLTEIEVEQEDVRIRVSRVSATQYVQAPVAAAPAAAAAAPAAAAPAVPAPRDNANAVNAPMVGTVYLSPAPGSRSFVEVGATVKEGQTLLIIEAMKTMNQIPAPRSGKVVEILVTDAQPVEYGEPLIVIE
ncbi:MAG: acetyl-CoA carboxylase biotin carboxyl carrier protein [Alphaproteobacteria bacterium]|jgi:acetyl-CoA carboxylase biotin carboxyl carrier protein|uniref:Biotin carboxyl carrier protein of acetyl-CoA carboxylase n=1 Tax=Pseudorhizobium pelagicum TaxID=1509405 RepID=A0A922P0M5_9HYPH|nr:acetyl-CoA carboxylase biotin carboxyl carrier protein [Pseudorhizobium pelagicum]MBU1317520.1 acetyl-CoA carboxylase biotin carboxyl carrier protein [Alphaproteobacteria bacterium]MDY6962376.1 acetyl-CoA carboxylase biotin carboxyl carrier protein [Pseudomonadota bacterium]KEQ06788.1 acetyl-CoA carboxylase [Pseudorhizobium pelagicum]KEQ08631.1 acetyl-CoA carboxylase [Pseudorhizobium pelagicum]MBU1551952.1 acetyl-CoA carboxylase biotin carboxyl carrier protein [Alphaproteobacteria bacterium|tara:strand:+ start:19696 stop:20157 length:462 start_codon:yes stop_codon:yes gene_type:complete